MAYKKTQAAQLIDDSINRYADGMRLAGKKMKRIYLTSKQVDVLIADTNKLLKDKDKDAKEIKELKKYKNYDICIYNP